MRGVEVELRKRLPGFELDVGWAVGDGVAVLFGHSGVGKSLTLSLIAGLTRPDAGHVRIAGETLFDAQARVDVPTHRRGLGYVSQSLALFPHMSLRQNVAYGLRRLSAEERQSRVGEVAEALHVAELLDRRPHEVSGGQRQRVAIARALAPRPRALLLDEPFSALDLPLRREMRGVVREAHERFGIPVLLVTHDPYEAFEMADTMVVYGADGVVQYGRPDDLYDDPGTPAIRRLLHSADHPIAAPTPAIRIRRSPPLQREGVRA